MTDDSFYTMLQRFERLPYFKVMVIDGVVVAWMAAIEGSDQHHSSTKALSQIYYHTSLTGVKAVKALWRFHDHLMSYARRNKYEIVITSSSLPNKEGFNRALELRGWRRHQDKLFRLVSNQDDDGGADG